MDPVTLSALITAGGGLLGGIMQADAENEARRQNLFNQLMQSKMGIEQDFTNQQKSNLSQLLNAYKTALGQ